MKAPGISTVIRSVLLTFFVCISSACASKQQHAEQLAQIPIIVSALKCAFATALIKENDSLMKENNKAVRRLHQKVVAGTLTLKLVHTAATDVGAKVVVPAAAPLAGPFVFALGEGTGSIAPNLSSGVKRTNTITTELPFRFYLVSTNNDACNRLSDSQRAKFGLSEWLAEVINGMDANVDYSPCGEFDAITFSQDFAGVDVTKAGVDFNFVFLAMNVGKSAELK